MERTRRATNSKIRVFLVDDHPIVRRGFQLLLGMEPDLMVCGEADSGPAALEKIIALKPDVAIVDLSLKASNGLELIKQIRAQSLKLKLLVFTMRDEGIYAERALRAGARGYIMKQEGGQKFLQAIRQVLSGRVFVSEKMSARILENFSGAQVQVPDGLADHLHRNTGDDDLVRFNTHAGSSPGPARGGRLPRHPRSRMRR